MELGPFGISEILFIAILALVVFGPRRLPELGHALGRAVTKFRRATTELRRTWEAELDEESRQEIASAARTLREVRDDLATAGQEAWKHGDDAARATRAAAADVTKEIAGAARPRTPEPPDGGPRGE